ncbi:MAG: type III secretion system inner membrane ring subunit SctD [Anaerolineae bacterium]
MAGYLIAEEGPLSGQILRFEGGLEWILGRDPDEAELVLEDPMVSRRHVICRLTPEGFLLENLSSVNPATQNGKVITEAVLLREGDIVQIGSTFFRFTEKSPFPREEEAEIPPQTLFEDASELSSINFDLSSEGRWLLKVISGPNAGAEFTMQKSSTYIIGKDPNTCDIVFQDLSVSRQHARLSVDEEEKVFVEDLGSRNGVLVNGELIADKRTISSQDLIALGTTTFLIIDREQIHETIVSPPAAIPQKAEAELAETEKELMEKELEKAAKRDWRELIIPRKHLAVGGLFAFFILCFLVALFSLFKTQPVVLAEKNETEQIQEAIHNYQDIQFSFNTASGKLFLVGHVLTSVDQQELLYILKTLPFIEHIDDNVVVDEFVWQNMNALLVTNPEWQGISIHSPAPGRFVMRGYLQTLAQAQALSDYVNMNFPYVDRLENQVVIESNLMTQIQSMLAEKGFSSVQFQVMNGDLVLQGRVDAKHVDGFNEIIGHFKALRGIRSVTNFVILTTADTSRVDLSTQYQVSGYSKKDESNLYVVINGRILAKGDVLDGMIITKVEQKAVLLEKDGLKFKINYNLQ